MKTIIAKNSLQKFCETSSLKNKLILVIVLYFYSYEMYTQLKKNSLILLDLIF